MLYRLISRLHQTGLVLGAPLARKLRIVSRTRLRVYQSSPIPADMPPHRYVRHEMPTEAQSDRLQTRGWNPPDLTPYWQAKFRAAPDAAAWQFVLYEYERRN